MIESLLEGGYVGLKLSIAPAVLANLELASKGWKMIMAGWAEDETRRCAD